MEGGPSPGSYDHPWQWGVRWPGALGWYHRNYNWLRVGRDDFKEEIRTHLLDRVSECQAAKSTDVYYSWTVVILF